MKPKIIIADDQQTTQKVVKVYISKLEEDPNLNLECELIECTDEKDLIPLVKEHQPQLVLLDFNLSENKTGYDLAAEIKGESEAKILVLYGTFDKVDESLFSEAGINDYAVKPMDVIKFLGQLQSLLEEYSLDHDDEEEATKVFNLNDLNNDVIDEEEVDELEFQSDDDHEEDEFVSDEIYVVDNHENDDIQIDEGWVVQQPMQEELAIDDVVSKEELNQLEAGMQDWGIDIPPVIGESDSPMRLPPIIENSTSEDRALDRFPSDEDLEYPDEITSSESLAFTPMSDLSPLAEDEKFETKEIGLYDTLGTSTPEEVKALEDQISDEVEITSTYQIDDLWNSDEVEEEQLVASESYIDEDKVRSDFDREPTFANIDVTNLNQQVNLSEDEINLRIQKMLAPLVEKIVREKVDSILEKVSWEVVPDLAENLIKKELKEISNQILNAD